MSVPTPSPSPAPQIMPLCLTPVTTAEREAMNTFRNRTIYGPGRADYQPQCVLDSEFQEFILVEVVRQSASGEVPHKDES